MTGTICALEGISGAGKTTLAHALYGYAVLPELPAAYGDGTGFPPFMTETAKALETNEWFLEREIERCRQAKACASPVVADRWYHSILSVSYARHALFGTADGDALRARVDTLTDAGMLFTPPLVIIDVPVDVAMSRLSMRYGDDALMRRLNLYPAFLAKQQEFYRSIGATVLDGTLPIEENVSRIVGMR